MKVSDVMNKEVESVTTGTSVVEVCRHIFGRGINGVPVCKNNKIVGFITERDILAKFYPSMKDYVEDPFHSGDFEDMEKKSAEVLLLKAEDIMSKNPTVISADAPLLRAQSIMFIHKVGRLPVVDRDEKLVGIISKGDIFRAIVGNRLPFEEEEGFYDWMAKSYDMIINWDKRLAAEIPDLKNLFKREKVKKIMDIASGTGEHAIALAKEKYIVKGFDASRFMIQIAESKKEKLSTSIKKQIQFITGNYTDTVGKSKETFDAALFLGNVIQHVVITDKDILKHTAEALRRKRAVLVFQIANLDKIFKVQNGYRAFIIRPSRLSRTRQAFLRFYTQDGDQINYNLTMFEYQDSQWKFRGIHSTPVTPIGKKEITMMLKKLGFSNILFYGGALNGPLFLEPFKPLESDWLNVIAIRE